MTHITHVFGYRDFIGEHCILFSLKSQFHYEAKVNVEAFYLDKSYLINVLMKQPA
jgi:hypothetical protein